MKKLFIFCSLALTLTLLPSTFAYAGSSDDFFPNDANTLAIFEFNGNVNDASGNNRNATLLDGASTFTPSTYGQGLVLPDINSQAQGIDWSTYKSLLVPPYTVEALIYPADLNSWKRLFTQDTDDDNGLYYYDGSLVNYPDDPLEGVSLPVNTLHCLAWSAPVSPANVLNLYLDGQLLGQVGRTYNEPTIAHFFMDDTTDVPNENLEGYVDAMRISNVARTGTELATTCAASNSGETLINVLDRQQSQLSTPTPTSIPPTIPVASTTPNLPETGSDNFNLAFLGGLLVIGGAFFSLKFRTKTLFTKK